MNHQFRERRKLIKLASGLMVAPFASLAGGRAVSASAQSPLRMLTIIDSYGIPQTTRNEIWVKSAAGDYALTDNDLGTILSPLKAYRDNMLIPTGINMDSLARTGNTRIHSHMTVHTLNGSRVADQFDDGPTRMLHPSLDVRVGDYLNNDSGLGRAFPHLFFSNVSQANETTFCRDTSGNVIRSIAGAKTQATRLFADIDVATLQFANGKQQGVLDLVQQQVQALRGQLNNANANELMDAYQSSVNDLAAQLQVSSDNVCSLPTDIDEYPGAVGGQSTTSTPYIFENIYRAFSCDLASSLTYSIGGEMINQLKHGTLYSADEHAELPAGLQSNLGNNMHAISHQSSDSANTAHELIRIHQSELIADLLDKMSVAPDVDGNSLLDNTVVFWTSAMANNTHSKNNFPYFLIAGKNTNLKGGYHYDCSGSTNNDLLTTIAQGMYLPDDSFGGHNRKGVYLNDLNNGPISKMLLG